MLGILNRYFGGLKWLQPMYELFFKIGLYGMNFGQGSDFRKSGESHAVQLIFKLFEKHKELIVFDVGANNGEYSKMLLGVCEGRRLTIHAFEPLSSTFKMMSAHLNDYDNVIKNNFGLSGKQEENLLYFNHEGSGLTSYYERNLDFVNIKLDKSEKVNFDTLDNYCLKKSITNVNFLKIDVEGHEMHVLKGASNMLASGKIDVIQFEFGGACIDSRVFFKDFYELLSTDFNLFRVLRNGLHPLKIYSELDEIFTTSRTLVKLV